MDLTVLKLIFGVCVFALSVAGSLAPLVLVGVIQQRMTRRKHAEVTEPPRIDSGSVAGETAEAATTFDEAERRAVHKALTTSRRVNRVLSLANSFSCGTFFALCTMIMIPASRNMWERLAAGGGNGTSDSGGGDDDDDRSNVGKSFKVLIQFPWGDVLIALAFTLLVAVDSAWSSGWSSSSSSCSQGFFDCGGKCLKFGPAEDDDDDDDVDDESDFNRMYVSLSDVNHSPHPGVHEGPAEVVPGDDDRRPDSRVSVADRLGPDRRPSPDRKLGLVLFGVAWHNLLEGVTLGSQGATSGTVSTFAAIAMHASILALATSSAALRTWFGRPAGTAMTLRKCTSILVAFCLIQPTGVLLGMALSSATSGGSRSAAAVNAVLSSISAGMFTYVAFVHMIPGELLLMSKDDDHGQVQQIADKSSESDGAREIKPLLGHSGRHRHHPQTPPTDDSVHEPIMGKTLCFALGWILIAIVMFMMKQFV